jgi:hypothetical protein
MGHSVAAAALTLAASSAGANPLLSALKADGGTICFTRSYDDAWIKSHPGQTLRQATLSMTRDPRLPEAPTLRLTMQLAGRTLNSLGACTWFEGDLNRGVQDNVLIASFKPTTGVGCHLYTDVTLASAEEGGEFPMDWQAGGKTIEIHVDESMAGWRGTDVRKNAGFATIRPADRIIRLQRARPAACREQVTTFAPGSPG